METEQEILQANQKLLDRRGLLKATDNLGPLTESIKDVLKRVEGKAKRGDFNTVYDVPGEYSLEVVEPDKSWKVMFQCVPKLYAACSFETFVGNEKLIEGIKVIAKTDDHIVLRGQTGCGKTHLAISILKESKHGKFITVPDLLLKIRSSFNGGKLTEDEIIKEYAEYPLLILDDLGAEKTSEYSITTLYIIIDRRIRDMKKTIITTNMTQAQIEETLGARIASRLSGMENIKINMPDYRKKR